MAPKYFIKRKSLVQRRQKISLQLKILKEELNSLREDVINEVESMQRMLQAMENDIITIDEIIAKKDKDYMRPKIDIDMEILHGRF